MTTIIKNDEIYVDDYERQAFIKTLTVNDASGIEIWETTSKLSIEQTKGFYPNRNFNDQFVITVEGEQHESDSTFVLSRNELLNLQGLLNSFIFQFNIGLPNPNIDMEIEQDSDD